MVEPEENQGLNACRLYSVLTLAKTMADAFTTPASRTSRPRILVLHKTQKRFLVSAKLFTRKD